MPVHHMGRFLLIVLLLSVGLWPALAQEDLTLVPYESQFGFSGVYPDGWTEAAPGTFARDATTVLIQQAAPMTAADFGALLVQQLGLGALPEPSDGISTAALTWTVYDVEAVEGPSGTFSAAIAVADGEQGYVVVLLATPDAFAALRETVFVPAVTAILPAGAGAGATAEATADGEAAAASIYQSADGLFSVPVPTNWTVTEGEAYGLITDPEGLISVHVLAVESDDPAQAVDDAFRRLIPNFDLALDDADILEPPSSAGVERTVVVTYDSGEDAEVVYQGFAQVVAGRAYLTLYSGDLAAILRRQAQANTIVTGLEISALETVDLSGVMPAPVDDAVIAQLESFINDILPVAEVPGMTVAIVQDGAVVYEQGFGVRALGSSEPVTPETLFMIGSTTKTFTTLYLAQLVDRGILTWDTPVVEILPDFALADPEITAQITVRNLVCACSGVPRRDLELIFNASELSGADVIASLSTFQVFTDFGEAFQYSNQLVAMGGYAGALANGASVDTVYSRYVADVEALILEPLGMVNTTFDFDAASASGLAATPHGVNLGFVYYPLDLGLESFVTPIAPAGALWSNVQDLSRYMLMEMREGIAPDGTRLVSEENLRETWQPQVSVTAEMRYGLGWFVDAYKGQRLLQHGGNTFGFTSDFAFLPDSDLGIVVLTNASGANIVTSAVRTRLFELVFDQEADTVRGFEFATQQGEAAIAGSRFTPDYDTSLLADYVGSYTNPALGALTLTVSESGALTVDVGEFAAPLWASLAEDGTVDAYLLASAPLTGVPLEFTLAEDGTPQITLDVVTDTYLFTPTP